MAKELPFFQFEPAEYLTKDISFCSLEAQGLFINICSYYWQRECVLSKDQFLKRINKPVEFEELVKEGIFDLVENEIVIKFLDLQYNNATKLQKINSINGSKGGRPKKEKPIQSEIKPNQNPNESESKGIREEKRREEEIKEENIKINTPLAVRFSFLNSLLELGISEQIAKDWLQVRKTKKLSNTETAFKNLLLEFDKKKEKSPHEIIEHCVVNSWGGFKSSWDWESSTKKDQSNPEPEKYVVGRQTQKSLESSYNAFLQPGIKNNTNE